MEPPVSRLDAVRRHIGSVLALLLFVLAVVAIRAMLHDVDGEQILQAVRGMTATTLGLAGLCVAGSYAFLVGYDASALRHIGRRVPARTLAVGSFCAYAMGNTVGLAVLSGGAVRHRFYQRSGLGLRDVTIVSTFCALAFGISVSLVGLVALVVYPDLLEGGLPVPAAVLRWSSAAALIVSVTLLAAGSLYARPIGIGRFRMRMPVPSVLMAQVVFSLGELSLAALALFLLLPETASIGYPRFVCLFAAASLVAALSHVPGGVGVFDGLMIGGLGAHGESVPGAAAAVLVYRALYYLGPFLMSVLLVGTARWWFGPAVPVTPARKA